VVAWQRNRERRRVSRTGRGSKSSSIALWWQTSGPAAAWHDRQSSRRAEKNIRRQIEERQRLRKHQE
jgi:hypothetical protein